MDSLQAAILGAIQGLTEFLPISSSGHLSLAKLLFAKADGLAQSIIEQSLAMDVLLHIATALAIMAVFRKDLQALLSQFAEGFRRGVRGQLDRAFWAQSDTQMILCVIVATLPTGVIGLFMKDFAEQAAQHPTYLGYGFFVTAALLTATYFFRSGEKHVTLRDALIIGMVQGIAVLPGISRSGSTIAAALALGIARPQAARFSFLLSLPAIAGAAILEFEPAFWTDRANWLPIVIGMASAFMFGILGLWLLLRLVKQGRLWVFAPYVAAVGAFTILGV